MIDSSRCSVAYSYQMLICADWILAMIMSSELEDEAMTTV